ncbi:MAG TPA: SUF system NifU family Fe-S cluster assembly protein [Alphaproteobacteria bacterium]|nr:SUF system NifU family Fe-S cluster assembly protein [Alphaproteobacteria bacterium]
MDDLRNLYQEVILDHGKHPRNFGHPADANRTAHGHNAMCGDTIDVFLTVDDKGRIRHAAFEGQGCAISVASASMMTEMLKGRTAEEAKRLFGTVHALCTGREDVDLTTLDDDTADRVQVLSGVRQYPMRVKCATLAWHTMEKAMEGGSEPVSTESVA